MVTQDDSRERPESAVTDDSGNRGQEPDKALAEKGRGHAEHETTSGDLADDKDADKKKKKHRRDPGHTRLSSATNRAAEKGDAER